MLANGITFTGILIHRIGTTLENLIQNQCGFLCIEAALALGMVGCLAVGAMMLLTLLTIVSLASGISAYRLIGALISCEKGD